MSALDEIARAGAGTAVQDPPLAGSGTQGSSSGTPTPEPSIEDRLKSLNLKQDQIQRVLDSGLINPKPSKLDDLTPELKLEVERVAREREQKAAQVIKEQLYDSVTKSREEVAALKAAMEANEKRIRDEEAAKQAIAKAEEDKKRTLEEKLEAMRIDFELKQQQSAAEADRRVKEIEAQLQLTALVGLREKLILQAGTDIIPELVANPMHSPGVTAEEITASVEMAKAKYQEIQDRIRKEVQVTGTTTPAPTPSQGVVVQGNDSHLSGGTRTAPVTPANVRAMGLAELQKTKEAVLAKYGFLSQ